MTETFTTPPADATPTPGASTAPTNAAEANAQLRALTGDRKWVERFLAGNGPEKSSSLTTFLRSSPTAAMMRPVCPALSRRPMR